MEDQAHAAEQDLTAGHVRPALDYVWTVERQIQPLWADIADRARELERYEAIRQTAEALDAPHLARQPRRHFLGTVIVTEHRAGAIGEPKAGSLDALVDDALLEVGHDVDRTPAARWIREIRHESAPTLPRQELRCTTSAISPC